MNKVVIGIDPGKNGGIAVLGVGDVPSVHKVPSTERDLWDFLKEVKSGVDLSGRGVFVFLEEITALPKAMRGSVASFKFGVHYGGIRMALIGLGFPFESVRPAKWQKEMRCLSKGDKRVTKARAQELFPEVKVTHWNADALLIAEYGRRVLFARGG